MKIKSKIIISCEHASNLIPKNWVSLFENDAAKEALNSHEGLDIGAKKIARYFAKELSSDVVYAKYSRLLIELNRSISNPKVFSKFSKNISKKDKRELITGIYLSYRNEVENKIIKYLKKNQTVVHLSIHSFTPVLNAQKRTADIGLLYDPQRILEKKLSSGIKKEFKKKQYGYVLRLNYPYKGTNDGFTTYLRKKYSDLNYAGIEIEFNQKYFLNDNWNEYLIKGIVDIIKDFCT